MQQNWNWKQNEVATLPAFSICVRLLVRRLSVRLSVLPVIRQIMSTRTQLLAASQGRPQRGPCGWQFIGIFISVLQMRRHWDGNDACVAATCLNATWNDLSQDTLAPPHTPLATGHTHSDRPKSVWRFRLQHFSCSRGTLSRPHWPLLTQNLVRNMICPILVDCKPISISLSHFLVSLLLAALFRLTSKRPKPKFNCSTVFWTIQFLWPWNLLDSNNNFGYLAVPFLRYKNSLGKANNNYVS